MTNNDYNLFYPYGTMSGYAVGYESSFGEESSADGDENDPDLDDRKDDQESTEPENEHTQVSEDVSAENEPPKPGKCGFWDFRNKVKQKKAELKAQYGKGAFMLKDLTACGIAPVRLNYNPIVRIGEVKTCIGWEPSCNKKCLGICCGSLSCVNWSVIPGNTQAYDAATARYNADKAKWDECRSQNGPWKRGWRYHWRKFVKNGGLKQLAQQCKAEMQGPTTTTTTTTSASLGAIQKYQYYDVSGMTCRDIAKKFNIIPGKKWGTAPENVKLEWVTRGCTQASIDSGIDPIAPAVMPSAVMPSAERTAETTEQPKDNKKMYIIIAVVVVLAVVGFFLYKKFKK